MSKISQDLFQAIFDRTTGYLLYNVAGIKGKTDLQNARILANNKIVMKRINSYTYSCENVFSHI